MCPAYVSISPYHNKNILDGCVAGLNVLQMQQVLAAASAAAAALQNNPGNATLSCVSLSKTCHEVHCKLSQF